ncbi:MAG: hypothetical protein ABEJ00_03320, partial [Gemmatimonadota bacterium]
MSARVDAGAPRLLRGAARLAAAGHVPGGTGRNREALEGTVEWAAAVDEERQTLLAEVDQRSLDVA